ncbi:MAG: hypothetical protein LBT33_00415 [Spirochaetia bacterium]|nr:hypothetical protein [Spirochaetia bacterium]
MKNLGASSEVLRLARNWILWHGPSAPLKGLMNHAFQITAGRGHALKGSSHGWRMGATLRKGLVAILQSKIAARPCNLD